MLSWRFISIMVFLVFLLLGAGGGPAVNGREEVATLTIPQADLDKMIKAKSEGLLTDGWTSPVVHLDSAKNPFHVSIEVTGRTDTAGDARNVFGVAWMGVSGKPEQGSMQLVRFGKADQPAGAIIHDIKATPPLHLKTSRDVNFAVNLTQHAVLVPTQVTLHVWSGLAANSWRETLAAFRYLWVALIVGVAVLWTRQRKAA